MVFNSTVDFRNRVLFCKIFFNKNFESVELDFYLQ